MHDYLIVATIILAGLLVVELFARLTHTPKPIMRKVVHVAMAILVMVLSYILSYTIFIALGVIFGILMLILRFIWPLESLADRATDSYGEVFFAFGVAACAALSNEKWSFILSICILGLADTAAYFIGRRIRSKRLLIDKTAAGCGAFISVALLLLFPFVPFPQALMISCLLATIELISPYGSDNLSIPIAATILLGVV